MLKVLIFDGMKDINSGKVFFCDAVNVYEAGNFKFCVLTNKRAKVKSSQIPLNPDQCVFVTEDR